MIICLFLVAYLPYVAFASKYPDGFFDPDDFYRTELAENLGADPEHFQSYVDYKGKKKSVRVEVENDVWCVKGQIASKCAVAIEINDDVYYCKTNSDGVFDMPIAQPVSYASINVRIQDMYKSEEAAR